MKADSIVFAFLPTAFAIYIGRDINCSHSVSTVLMSRMKQWRDDENQGTKKVRITNRKEGDADGLGGTLSCSAIRMQVFIKNGFCLLLQRV